MLTLVSGVTQFLSVLAIIAQAVSVFLLVSLVFRRQFDTQLRFFGRHAILIAFIVALVAMSGSLFFSEVAGYEPCKLCWYQRILMYPLALLSGIALFRKENWLIPYALVMSIIGQVIAAYHYFLQIGALYNIEVDKFAPCSTVGYSASCTSIFQLKLPYIYPCDIFYLFNHLRNHVPFIVKFAHPADYHYKITNINLRKNIFVFKYP